MSGWVKDRKKKKKSEVPAKNTEAGPTGAH